MSSLIHLKKATPVFLVGLVLACFALPQWVQATDLGSVLPGGNTADGFGVLTSLTTGGFNTGTGWFSLKTVSSGSSNTAFGAATLFANTGDLNTAIGTAALFSNTTGGGNTANGVQALFSNTTGGDNTAIGDGALSNNTSGANNVALGFNAGSNQTTGSDNVYIGAGLVGSAGESNTCYIAHISGQTSGGGVPVLINATGKLGTMTSSKRFKEEIKPMDKASAVLFSLKPVSFHYKKEIDPSGTSQFGLVAEDVEKVNPALVVRDKEGKPYSVRYDQVNAMLLNEFLKEHKKIENQGRKLQEQRTTMGELKTTVAKQERIIAQQQKGMDVLTAQLKEQAAQIQKVNAEFEETKSKPQMAVNNR